MAGERRRKELELARLGSLRAQASRSIIIIVSLAWRSKSVGVLEIRTPESRSSSEHQGRWFRSSIMNTSTDATWCARSMSENTFAAFRLPMARRTSKRRAVVKSFLRVPSAASSPRMLTSTSLGHLCGASLSP